MFAPMEKEDTRHARQNVQLIYEDAVQIVAIMLIKTSVFKYSEFDLLHKKDALLMKKASFVNFCCHLLQILFKPADDVIQAGDAPVGTAGAG
jgi:hypothetical protein